MHHLFHPNKGRASAAADEARLEKIGATSQSREQFAFNEAGDFVYKVLENEP